MKLCTVVYEITDPVEWGKRNPLHYAHDGLKAVHVGIGDGLEAREALSDIMPYVEEDYWGDCATEPFRRAVERARKALKGDCADEM